MIRTSGVFVAFSLILFLLQCGRNASDEQPNILWITSEDNGTFLGCYGDPVASTPNLDRLAGEGIRYESCFANAPVCALVRSSWILGVPAITTGTHNMRSRYRVPEELTPYPVLLKEAGYYVTNNSKTDYNTSSFEKEIWDECGNEAHFRNRQEGQPFFAVFNLTVSHEGQIFPEHYPERYPEATIPAEHIKIPPYQVKTPEVIMDWQRMYERIGDMDRKVGELLKELEESGEAENTIIFYNSDHAGITMRSKRLLYHSGTHVPFLAYFPEKFKHMAPSADNGISSRLVQFIDMPRTWLSLAGAEIPEYMPGRILCGPGEEDAPQYVLLFSGRFDECPDMSRGLTDGRWKYIRNYEPDRPWFQMLEYPLRQVGQVSQWKEYAAGRTNELQSAFYQAQSPECLFDTEADPHEIRNLAGDPAYAGQLDKMRRELDRQLLEARDAGFIPEPLMARIDRDSSTTIYQYCQDAGNYPLKEIMDLAFLASRQDPENIRQLIPALGNENPIFRYWAILGLRVLGKEAAEAEEAIRSALEDPAMEVRVNAALALGNLGFRDEAGVLLLKEARSSVNDAEANWALDGIKYLDVLHVMEGVAREEVARGGYSGRTYERILAGASMNRPAQTD